MFSLNLKHLLDSVVTGLVYADQAHKLTRGDCAIIMGMSDSQVNDEKLTCFMKCLNAPFDGGG